MSDPVTFVLNSLLITKICNEYYPGGLLSLGVVTCDVRGGERGLSVVYETVVNLKPDVLRG